MQGESKLVRALWPVLVLSLVGYLLVDMVSHPVWGTPSVAATPPPLTLWVPSTEATGGAETVADQTAAELHAPGRDVRAATLPGGSTGAITAFLGPYGHDRDGALVVTSTMLSDLAREREDSDVPGAAQQAAVAQRQLARAVPIAVLSDDPLMLAVPRRSPIASADALLASMRQAPWSRRFAIANDTFSRGNLAALVRTAQRLDPAAPAGQVPFQIYGTPAEALAAMGDGHADAVLATRSAIRSGGAWRALPWPATGGPAPQSWIALVAHPDVPARRVRELRRAVAAVARSSSWRRALRAQGRTPVTVATDRLPAFLRAAGRRAASLQRLVRDVERR